MLTNIRGWIPLTVFFKWFSIVLMKQGCGLNLFDIPVFVWYHYFVKK